MNEVITHGGKKETYIEFVEKFKPKLTTDDCYTPAELMDGISKWVRNEYGLDGRNFVRPFYPGGDYQAYQYQPGDVVVDNPPFSILSEIVKYYVNHDIPFFIFGPALTPVKNRDVSHVFIDHQIRYENGARVKTCFITNLETLPQWRTAPDLNEIVKEIQARLYPNTRKARKWPKTLIDAARLMKICNRGGRIRIACKAMDDPDKETRRTHFGVCYELDEASAGKLEKIEHGLCI